MLVRVFICQNVTLSEITCHGSFICCRESINCIFVMFPNLKGSIKSLAKQVGELYFDHIPL